MCTIENADSKEASLNVVWCTEHFCPCCLKCFENYATADEANPGLVWFVPRNAGIIDAKSPLTDESVCH